MGSNLDAHVQAYQGQSIYDFDNRIQLKWYPERIVKFSAGAHSLLELGLGHGITADVFGRHFKRHVVIDASPAVIANFRRQYPESQAEIVAAGYTADDVQRVVRMLYRSEFKRRQSAPGPRVSTCAFGRERRYPISSAWR